MIRGAGMKSCGSRRFSGQVWVGMEMRVPEGRPNGRGGDMGYVFPMNLQSQHIRPPFISFVYCPERNHPPAPCTKDYTL